MELRSLWNLHQRFRHFLQLLHFVLGWMASFQRVQPDDIQLGACHVCRCFPVCARLLCYVRKEIVQGPSRVGQAVDTDALMDGLCSNNDELSDEIMSFSFRSFLQ